MKFQIKTWIRGSYWYVTVSRGGSDIHSGHPSFATRDEAKEYGKKLADRHVEYLARKAEEDKQDRYEDYETNGVG